MLIFRNISINSQKSLIFQLAGKTAGIDKVLEWTARFPKMFIIRPGLGRVRVLLHHPECVKKVLVTSGTEKQNITCKLSMKKIKGVID